MSIRLFAIRYSLFSNPMRHHDKNRKLGREKSQRVALLRSLARSLLLAGGITTTTAKAKALRPYIERVITAGKSGTLEDIRRNVAKLGGARDATAKLRELAKRYEKRSGGYTRIVRIGRMGKRVSDMSRIELLN